MYTTTSVFDVLAADETDRRVASRRALALAHTRVDNRLGAFLQQAVTKDEFDARLAAVEDDLKTHVAEACEECGHDHPEHITASLIHHFERTRRWQPRGAAKLDKAERDALPTGDFVDKKDRKYPIEDKDHAEKAEQFAAGTSEEKKVDEEVHERYPDLGKDKKSAQGKQSAPLGSGRQWPPVESEQFPPELDQYSVPAPSADPQRLQWQSSPEANAAYEQWLAEQGGPPLGQGSPVQPSPYRQPIDPELEREMQGGDPSRLNGINGTPLTSRTADMGFDPSLQQDKEAEDICPACGGGGTSNSGQPCQHCGGHGYVAGYGNSVLDHVAKLADSGNTDLGGPEPKMDKLKWEPKNLDQRPGEESGGRWPTKDKDIIQPIRAENRDQDGHELSEIGEVSALKTETLPTASESNETGFFDGGETKGPTSWQGGDNQATPVTHEVQ